jgi:hypothetical protein
MLSPAIPLHEIKEAFPFCITIGLESAFGNGFA